MQKMNAIEFCLVMAINMEQMESMPDFANFDDDRRLYTDSSQGLCSTFSTARNIGLISAQTYHQLNDLVDHLFCKNTSDVYYWPPGMWKPRVDALRTMAKELMK